jgi:hypothetical protein
MPFGVQFGDLPSQGTTVGLGSSLRASALFTVFDTETALDPDDVFVSIKTPAAVLTTYAYPADAQIVRDSLGNFHIDINCDEAGTWYVRWFSEGNGQAADEESFTVEDAEAV